MSSRRPTPSASEAATKLRNELEALKQQTAAVEAAGETAQQQPISPVSPAPPAFDGLSGVEQAAGSLCVSPAAWKPIKFMNNSHYNTLVKNNALDDSLARRIEAFRAVAAA